MREVCTVADETVVEADGIRVTKSFDADDFPVPAVRFDVVSTRSDETTLTITDEIPEEFDIDQIGFHPEYGSEYWTATGEGVVRFDRPVEASESFTTVYGVRMSGDQEPSAFLEAPSVAVGASAETTGIEDIVPPESSDIVRELAGGRRDTIPGLEDEDGHTEAEAGDREPAVEAAGGSAPSSGDEAVAEAESHEPLLDALHEGEAEIADDEVVEPAVTTVDQETSEDTPAEPDDEVAIPDVDAGVAVSSTEETDDETDGETDETVMGGQGAVTAADVAAELADQIRAGEVADEDLDVLRSELAPTRSSVQLEHLQSRVSEMEAYADALGAFIDENGDARGVLDDLQSDVDAMQSDVTALQNDLEAAAGDRERIRETIADVEDELSRLDDVETQVERIAGDVDALDERVEGVEETVTAVEDLTDEVAELRQELQNIREWRDQLSDVFGA